MNLFRELTEKRRELSVQGLSLPKLGTPTIVTAIVVVGVFLMIFSTHLKNRRKAESLRVKIQAAETELQRLGELANRRVASSGTASKVLTPGAGLDGSWASVLWKFAAFTGSQIMIQEMSLVQSPGGAGGSQQVAFRGRAKNLGALKEWLGLLIQNMPGSEFVIDKQNLTGDKVFPLDFTARATVLW